ncbi:MAG: oligosaccharide flippase family protein, partial [Eubacteriales bacterium]|nr:oligosaccharide flippase family protein [Eubacteriales bacterium]
MQFLQNKIVKGTLILTIAGFITRILGFFYRIFLADRLGASLLGTYQLIFPVYGIAFTIYGAGIQTAISQIIASSCATSGTVQKNGQNHVCPKAKRILSYGMGISLCLSCTLLFLVQSFAKPIATYLLLEPSCTPYLRILSLLFPFCGITACLHGYYYGIQDAKIPAATQVVEQLCRLGFVFLILFLYPMSPKQGCIVAVWGLVVGEVGSNIYVVYQFIRYQITGKKVSALSIQSPRKNKLLSNLISVSITLTTTKLIMAL